MSNTEFFQERAESFEQARRRLESPRERARVKGSLSDTGSLNTRPAAAPVLAPRTITWGSAFKISVAVYFALIGVLVTVALLTVLGLRLLAGPSGTLDGITVKWAPVSSSSSGDLPDATVPGTT
ncbi:hypothetical protein LWF15_27150 [Kineosporia rhizophila]|uniref:hypothetical protein n=1 Tax=Kineosporia TaxID=49184 RepID=UPI001E2CB8DC|nr:MULTISPECIES: hypothetical protein [Kineosporia]MCE0539184.1 hypothetical protein [Kineosporia rhizophila]GLY18052.1 hypothetical protein Kisp01_50660 [Kineosporia sp. NBRC 101677]